MRDAREMLKDITEAFVANNAKWLHREVGNAQHALDDAAHQTALEELMGVLCENYDAFAAFPVEPVVDRAEAESPGR